MGLRLFILVVLGMLAPAAVAHGGRHASDGRVGSPGICWDPDVEFPVPCDDDD